MITARPSQRRRSPNGIARSPYTLFPFWFSCLAGIALLITAQVHDDDRVSSIAAAAVFGLCWWFCKRALRLDWLSPAMIYLLVFGVFHLGLVVPWALGIHSIALPDWLVRYSVTPALTLVMVALLCYQAGACLGVSRRTGVVSRDPRRSTQRYNVLLYQVGLAIACAGLLFLVLGIHSIGVQRFLQASYIDTFRLVREHDPRLFTTSLTLAPIGFYLAAACAPMRRLRWIVALIAGWTVLIMFIGFRSFSLVAFATCLMILRKRRFHLSAQVYLLGLLGFLVAIPVVRSMRNTGLANRSITEAIREFKPLAAVEEMGGSLEPLVYTLRLMENESFRWGKTYWQALKRVAPNLSLQCQGGAYMPLEDLPPTHWVTRLAAPWKYAHYGGIGFSGVAEPYMNFGVGGLIVYFVLIAMALVSVERLDCSNPVRLAMWGAMLGPLLLTTRGSFDSFFRPAIWGLVIVLASRVLSDSLHAMRRTRTAVLRPRSLAAAEVVAERSR